MQTIKTIEKEGYVIVQLNRGKVNAINALLVSELRETIKRLETDETVKGVILTGIPHFFSAGLDVIELYNYDEPQMRDFFIAFGSMHLELARFSKPLICAITGHSPAGGTVIAIAADYRIMAEGEKYRIGLNEVAVNVQISQNIVEGYAFWIGKRMAHQCIMEGKLLTTQEALAVGLVDEVVALEDALAKAEEKMKHYLMAHDGILKNTKQKIRQSWLERLNDDATDELELAMQMWFSPEVKARMKMFVEALSGKGK